MPREVITVQVGQCGNQVGRSFWSRVLQEHASASPDGRFDAPMSAYFRNVNARSGAALDDLNGPISCLKARAVLIDTEEGVLAQTLSGPLRELFDEHEFVKGVSGAGNNFAHGFYGYGEEYAEKIAESLRREVERCESLQAFFLLHSTGGGTGSGLGSRTLSIIEDHFPGKFRFAAPILPSEDDDVITSPYNAAFSLHELREHADCIFPMSNHALMDASREAEMIESRKVKRGERPRGLGSQTRVTAENGNGPKSARNRKDAFDEMNGIAAQMISNLTSCARFPGKMNLDLSELTTNLVPFPRMQFLLSGLSPLAGEHDRSSREAQKQQVDRMFAGVLSRSNQLLKADPLNGRFLACAMLVRGPVNLADIHRNVERLADQIHLPSWNPDAFKLGLCNAKPADQHHSMICLANNSSIRCVFEGMEERFRTLYGPRRKAYTHHYTNYMEEGQFEVALETLASLQYDYHEKFDETEELAASADLPILL